MRAIIFGISGQDGYYLKKILKSTGYDVIGVSRSKGNWITGSVADLELVESLVKEYKPKIIFHLAAISTTRHWDVFENHTSISTGTVNILEAVKQFSPQTKVFITGSGVQFENKGLPISEKDKFEASSFYSAERIHSVYLARYYRLLGIKAYVGYLFHHESPLRHNNHVSKIISNAVLEIVNGKRKYIEIMDLSVKKEWTFAGDVMEGILCLIAQDSIFEATIGSGDTYTIEDWVKVCFEYYNLDYRKYIKETKDNKPEYKELVSDPTTIKNLGWSNKVLMEDLCQMYFTHGNQ